MNRYTLPLFCDVFIYLQIIMTNHILQWNCRSVKANFEELNLLINKRKSVAVCLQETFLKDPDKFTLKCHSNYFKQCTTMINLHEFFATIVNNGVLHHFGKLASILQTVVVSISLNKTITLCSVYLPLVCKSISGNLIIL